MLFERFEDEDLSQYSYAVGCTGAGELAIIDPRRDVDIYLDFAAAQKLDITAVLETHIHADFASGAHELAERTGAKLYVSAYDEGEAFEVQFPHEALSDGDEVTLGKVRLVARHTPGHTPEHLSYLVYDGARSDEVPQILLSGDFLFVGSLGRPDLLGDDAKRALASKLYASVRNVLPDLPDGIEVHPGHGAGSMCGAGMSGRPTSTLGYERATNPYLDSDLGQAPFVDKILGSVPPFPPYYRRMKTVNSDGPAILEGLPGLEALSLDAFERVLENDEAVIIDLRDQNAFGGAHIPGAFGIGGDDNLTTWAAWVVPYERPLLLVSDEQEMIEPAIRSLVRVGLDDVRGYLDGGMAKWRLEGRPLASIGQLSAGNLSDRLDRGEDLSVIDVRSDSEFASGHVPGAVHIHGGQLQDRLDEVPDSDGPVVTICGGGYRSTVAASVLERAGYEPVMHVTGGMSAWKAADLPLEEPE